MRKTRTVILIAVLTLISMNLIEVRAQGQFVGSVNSDVYHYPSCTYAQRIKPENKIWFADAADAQSHGYRPCKVCHPPIPELAPFHMLVAAIIISSMIIILKRKSLYLGSHARFRDA